MLQGQNCPSYCFFYFYSTLYDSPYIATCIVRQPNQFQVIKYIFSKNFTLHICTSLLFFVWMTTTMRVTMISRMCTAMTVSMIMWMTMRRFPMVTRTTPSMWMSMTKHCNSQYIHNQSGDRYSLRLEKRIVNNCTCWCWSIKKNQGYTPVIKWITFNWSCDWTRRMSALKILRKLFHQLKSKNRAPFL